MPSLKVWIEVKSEDTYTSLDHSNTHIKKVNTSSNPKNKEVTEKSICLKNKKTMASTDSKNEKDLKVLTEVKPNDTSLDHLKIKKVTRLSNNLKNDKDTASTSDLSNEKITSTSKQAPLVPRGRKEIRKHRTNIIEVLLWSNATPVRRFDDMGYQCCYCKDQYVLPADLKKHTLETHQDVRKASFMKLGMEGLVVRLDITGLQCKLCKQNLDTLELLMEHLKVVHEKTIHTDLKNHITPFQFLTETPQCCICKNTFSKFKLLLEHLNLHYRNYICELCDTGFTTLCSFRKHMHAHNTGVFECDNCSKVFETAAKKKSHERIMHLPKANVYKCRICNETFHEYRLKEVHLVSIHGLKVPTSKCKACNKVFTNRKSLHIHIKRDHLMERTHKCAECDMSFFKARDLNHHMLKHTKVRTHECTVCSKAFGRAYTLKEHMKIHNNVRRFKCEHCGQAFVQKCSWKSHMKSKHDEIVN